MLWFFIGHFFSALLWIIRISRLSEKDKDAFDTVFESQDIRIVPIPIQVPNANAYSERWTRTVKEECLDYILMITYAGCFSISSTIITPADLIRVLTNNPPFLVVSQRYLVKSSVVKF